MTQTASTSQAIALLRVTSGSILLTHGLIKLLVFTPAGTAGFFESIGFPGILAYPVMAGEIGLGLALILGLMTRWAALAALPIMIGAIVPHAGNGFTFSNPGGGWEYPVFWTIVLASQAIIGDGAYAIGNPFKSKV
ncbi:DoxX family protein [Sphingobium cupriresistens]|uniref:DoxX family protein n=1 Tax=Sphingobium cupriresistens TaxID=1132417 RepID=A0A8G1ZDI9_9SPHN|nr:DoxX family protein [Sphingobium cupriresistens]RYM08239.1 DoxX family protein [Sphingobium cupriresistens]